MRSVRLWLQVSLPILGFAIFQYRSTVEDNCDGVCGRRPLAPSHGGSTRIIGGNKALPGTWPWMVSFCKVNGNRFSHFCGGSLIGSRWIISAAHCFLPSSNLEEIRAVIGLTKFGGVAPALQVLPIKQVITHKFYHRGNNNDIALVELDKAARCSDYVQPACLPDRTVDVPNLAHCYISGWGVMNVKARLISSTLKEAKVNLIPTEICNGSGWLYRMIKPDCLCAGFEAGGVDTCQGDSGGPLMCREARSERFWVVGITSFGTGCAIARKPGVYTATQKFIDWITMQSGQNFYRPVHLPVALTVPKPQPTMAPSRPPPQQQPQPWLQAPAQSQQVQPRPPPLVRPWPQSRPQPTVRPQPQSWPQSPVRPWPQSQPQPTVRPQPQSWPQSPVRPWPQSRPQPTFRPQPQPWTQFPFQPWPKPLVIPWPQSRPQPTTRPQPWSQSPVWTRPLSGAQPKPRPPPTFRPWVVFYSRPWPPPPMWLQTRPWQPSTVKPWAQKRPLVQPWRQSQPQLPFPVRPPVGSHYYQNGTVLTPQ